MTIGTIEWMLHRYARIRTRLFTLLLAGQFREIGSGSRIVPPFRFGGLHEISLVEGVIIHRDCWIHVIAGHGDETAPKLTIQSHAAIGMGATISAARRVVIGEHVLLARNVYISDHAHAFANPGVPIRNQGLTGIAPVVIGRHSWLGQNVVVLPGVTIGEHCVIGANAVVNSSIPDFSVAVGAPARVIKRYDPATGTWQRVKDL